MLLHRAFPCLLNTKRGTKAVLKPKIAVCVGAGPVNMSLVRSFEWEGGKNWRERGGKEGLEGGRG